MKILAPADNAREVDLLVEAGAGALYFGYIPREWLAGHSHLESMNRRTFPEAQVSSEEEVRAMVDAAGRRGVSLSATLNAASYPAWMEGPALETARRLLELGVKGFIVADPGLLTALRREGIGPLALSTLGGVFNTAAVRFWARRGVGRMTFPRELSSAEMLALARANPLTGFDAFVLYGCCPNAESFCRWVHDDPGRVWPCVKEYRPEAVAGEEMKRAAAAQAAWSGISRIWACGLCALHDLAAAGNIDGLKIVGRGAPTGRKLAGVRIVRGLLRALEEGVGREAFLAAARETQRSGSGSGCRPYLCSYPEYLP